MIKINNILITKEQLSKTISSTVVVTGNIIPIGIMTNKGIG